MSGRTLPGRLLLIAALVLGLGASPHALGQPRPAETTTTPQALLRKAANHFQFGNYDEAIGLLNGLLTPRVLLTDSDDVQEALKLLGIASPLQNDLTTARESFVRLLNLEPELRLDPLVVPPQVVEFFDGIRREIREKLEELRREQEREQEEQARLARAQLPVRLIREEVRIDEHPYWLNFTPLGLGQFELDRGEWGWFFLTSQLAALAANVTAASLVEATRNPDGTHGPTELARARDVYQPLQVASLVSFGLLLGWSIIDHLIAWRPADRRTLRTEDAPAPEGRP